MDKKKQHDTVKEKRKMKNNFSVPVKKSDTVTNEIKREPQAEHEFSCPETKLNLSSQRVFNNEQGIGPVVMASTANADNQKVTAKQKKIKSDDTKKDRERVTQTGKKKHKQALQSNTFCGDKLLHSTEQHGEADSKLHSKEQHDESDSISSETGSISRTIAEVIGRTKQKTKNVSDDSESFSENDVDNWDLPKTDVSDTEKNSQLINDATSEHSTGGQDSVCTGDGKKEETGTWVQCSNKACNKWRYLADVEDPVLVPENWDCTLNSDEAHKSCDIPEAICQENSQIYTKYTIGSVVWAKLDGYPWWPAMVEFDPDTDAYFEVQPPSRMVPLQYHVSFFDDNVTRSWVRARCVMPYSRGEMLKAGTSDGTFAFKKEIKAAMKNADRALTLSLKERIEIFGFLKRFSSKRVKAKRISSKDEKSTRLHGSVGNIFVKSESLDYTHGVHNNASLEGYEPPVKKNVIKRKPFVNKMIKDQKDQAQAHTPRNRQSDAGTNISDTFGATLPDKLSKTATSACSKNIRSDGNPSSCSEKENSLHSSLDKAQKKLHNKKRKHEKPKLHCTDDGDKHIKKFIFKESGTKRKPDGKENDTNHNTSVMDSREKHNLHDQPHNVDGHKLFKKSKYRDSKGRHIHQHQTAMQDSLKNDALVRKMKMKETRTHKKQNNSEEFSVNGKTTPCNKALGYKKNKEIKSGTDKITVNIHNESAIRITMRKPESNSDDGKEMPCTCNVKNTEQTSQQCNSPEKEHCESNKQRSNPDTENNLSKAAALSDMNRTLESQDVHIDSSGSTSQHSVTSKTIKKEIKGTIDLCQKKTDNKARKCTKIVIETKALYYIRILNPLDNVTINDSSEIRATGRFSLDDKEETVVTDQQIVPDMPTEMLDDCNSSPDLAFSKLSENITKHEVTDHLVGKIHQDKVYEDENDWHFASLKLEEDCPQKILNDKDSLDENSDDMILDLDESIGEVESEKTRKDHSLYDRFRDSFFEFESVGDVDFSDD